MQFNPRNPGNLPVKPNGERDWSSSLCACSDVGVCTCPCIVYGQLQTRLSYLNRMNAPHPSGGDGCGSDCMVHGALTVCCGIGWALQIGQRTAVRNRYSIEGNGCGDCMCAWCCTPCSLTQEVHEVDQEERALARAGAPQMYVQDGKM
ncbi:PLAC8-domain-containing protein [Schizopora paradoxa]|uniref:PLAC8-domain-containing protein n=1 Tax=Schizopora paradoxa TaxID=27342 RepID=A0A0H2RX00_9AGAM|nr:PLAC8-domain-containing protein [Schizopora paradoxa]